MAEEFGDKGLAVQLEDMVRDESGHSEETELILRDWPLQSRARRPQKRGGSLTLPPRVFRTDVGSDLEGTPAVGYSRLPTPHPVGLEA